MTPNEAFEIVAEYVTAAMAPFKTGRISVEETPDGWLGYYVVRVDVENLPDYTAVVKLDPSTIPTEPDEVARFVGHEAGLYFAGIRVPIDNDLIQLGEN